MNVYLTCKKCGRKRKFTWNLQTMPDVRKAVKEGWRSVDGKLYCPDCLAEMGIEYVDYETDDVMWKELLRQLPGGRKKDV